MPVDISPEVNFAGAAPAKPHHVLLASDAHEALAAAYAQANDYRSALIAACYQLSAQHAEIARLHQRLIASIEEGRHLRARARPAA